MKRAQPFGRYLLLDRIAVGGMAEVYGAKTFGVEGFERLCAIKRILPTMVEDDEFVAMFIDEARIAARLSHATIAQILELGRHEETYFIAMEYVAGRDVRLIIDKFRKRDEKMPVHLGAYIMAKMGEGLDYAHSKTDENGQPLNIIHRDISPQNIIVSYEGAVKIIDFGIAKAAGRNQKTQVGILKGKFAYMSPEQVRGAEIDHRSDLFSAGVMFYEMLTGSKLFTGESDFSTLEKVRVGTVRRPSELNPAIPPELEEVVMKALAKDREERYQNGAELHDDLMRYLYREGEVFSTRKLAQFMRTTFVDEVSRENERQHRWWSAVAEETLEFEGTQSKMSSTRGRSTRGRSAGGTPPPPPPDSTSVGELGQAATAIGRPTKPPDRPSASMPTLSEGSELGDQATRVGAAAASLDGATAIIQTADLESSATRVLPMSKATVAMGDEPAPAPVSEPIIARPGVPGSAPRSVPPPPPVRMANPPPPPSNNRSLVLVAGLIIAAIVCFFVVMQFRPKPAVMINVATADGRLVPGASATVDGQALEGQPPYSVRTSAGRHILVVAAPNFKPSTQAFTVPDDHDVLVHLEALAAPEGVTGATGLSGFAGTPGATGTIPAPHGQPNPEPNPGGTTATNPGHERDAGREREPRDAGRENPKDAGEKTIIVVEKHPDGVTTGSLKLITSPAGAMFKINGKGTPTERTPIQRDELPANQPISVTFMLSGYKRKEATVTLQPGEVTPLDVTLEPLPTEAEPSTGGLIIPLPQGTTQPEPTPVPEKKQPAGDKGTISVLCIPVSTVIIDGETTNRRTTTHAIPIEVSIGHHTVSCLSDQGKQSPTTECDVTPGSTCEYRKKVQ